MSGVLALGGDLFKWTPDEMAEAAGYVQQYKRIRHLVQHGELYRLNRGAVQYVARDASQAVAFVYAPLRPLGTPEPHTILAGLDARATYVDADTGDVHEGGVLLTDGLPVTLPSGDYASAVVHLIRR
jgi:alpha-galactosidase